MARPPHRPLPASRRVTPAGLRITLTTAGLMVGAAGPSGAHRPRFARTVERHVAAGVHAAAMSTTPHQADTDAAPGGGTATTVTAPPAEHAVVAWWEGLQRGDVTAIAELLDEQYVVTGGPDGRLVGRDEMLAQAGAFLGAATIEHWEITDVHTVVVGESAAVCTYRWEERGRHDGAPFHLSGWATDVLGRRGSGWVHHARHVSMVP